MTARDRAFTGGGLEHHEPSRPRVLAQRIDAFYLAFRGVLRDDVRAELATLAARAATTRSEVALDVAHAEDGGELRGAVSPRSREGWWLVTNAWSRIVINEAASGGWTLEVEPKAYLLMTEGARGALELARLAARALLEQVEEERVRRLDLCADLVGFDLAGFRDTRSFVVHHKTSSADISTVKAYWRAGKRTGFVFGRGDAVCRVYDKTEHLRLGLDDSKRDDEYSEWRVGGWDGRSDVVRLEYQLRGRLLDELELREPEKALERVDAVWSYATRKWLRLVDLATATRKERCVTDARWLVLQDVVFRERVKEPPKRVRAPATPHARRLIGAVTNYCAAAGLLFASPKDARGYVANWSNERAEAWIQQTLWDMAKPTIIAAKVDLLERFDDAREAAAHLMTKRGAAWAKYTRRTAFLGHVEETAAHAA